MYLSFTKDPKWITARELLWEEREDNIKEELTKQRVAKIKHYFMTGEVPKGTKLDVRAMVQFFPKFDIEGLAYCFKHIIPSDINDEQFRQCQAAFCATLDDYFGLTLEEYVVLFKHVFGEKYDPNKGFPFLIGTDSELRKVSYNCNLLFEHLNKSFHWFRKKSQPKLYTCDLLEFYFSMFPYIDERMFKRMAEDEREICLPGGASTSCILKVVKLMQWSVTPPDFVNDSEEEERRQFLKHFHEKMDSLEHYPGDLKELWEEAKQGVQ